MLEPTSERESDDALGVPAVPSRPPTPSELLQPVPEPGLASFAHGHAPPEPSPAQKREISRFCAGDGSGGACPCANEASPGSGTGCKSSLGVGGLLGTAGTPSASSDSRSLVGSSMPNTSVLY